MFAIAARSISFCLRAVPVNELATGEYSLNTLPLRKCIPTSRGKTTVLESITAK